MSEQTSEKKMAHVGATGGQAPAISQRPMPWSVPQYYGVCDASGRLVADFGFMDEADAEFICRACNTHEALLAALKESHEFWTELERGLVQAAERNATRVDASDLLIAVRKVLAIEHAALAKVNR